MYGTGIGTSLLLIAIGAVLAFAVTLQTTGISINTIGVILMVVGLIGLLFSFLLMGDYFGLPWGRRYDAPPPTPHDPSVTPPHTHRREEVSDVVYEDERGTRVERVRRTDPHTR